MYTCWINKLKYIIKQNSQIIILVYVIIYKNISILTVSNKDKCNLINVFHGEVFHPHHYHCPTTVTEKSKNTEQNK